MEGERAARAVSRRAAGLLLAVALLLVRAEAAESEAGPNGHRLIRVPAGTYALGEEGHALNPAHRAVLRVYRIADAETTNEQWAAFVKATGYVTDAERRGFGKTFRPGMPEWVWEETPGACWRAPRGPAGPAAAELPAHPVTQISGADATAYCRWLGARLPTLDEWEAAARAGSRTRWPWGDTFRPGAANIWNGKTHATEPPADGFTFTAPVRTYAPNRWGLYDVIGNVFEYCAGLPQPLRGREAALIAGRGGSWWCSAGTCSAYNLADIGRMDRHGSMANQGFRVVFDVAR